MNNYTEQYPGVRNNTGVNFWTVVEQSPLRQATVILWQVWSPCLLLLGGFGNVATIFVLRRVKEHNSSHHVFLTALAVTDLTCLYTHVLVEVICYSFRVCVWNLHPAPCKLCGWLRSTSYTVSAWLVTAVTIQRTMAIRWPHKIRVMCTVRRTWTVVGALVFVACALYSHIAIMLRLQDNNCSPYLTASYKFFYQHINPWLSVFLVAFLPFFCLLVCDVILSLSLFQASSSTSVSNQAISTAPSVHSDNSRRETAKRTTVMILTLSISFIILTLPLQIVVTWYHFNTEQIFRSPQIYALYFLMNSGGWLLMATNSAINFFLYCFTGTRFRREFLNWIRCRVGDPSSGSVGKAASVSSKGEREPKTTGT